MISIKIDILDMIHIIQKSVDLRKKTHYLGLGDLNDS